MGLLAGISGIKGFSYLIIGSFGLKPSYIVTFFNSFISNFGFPHTSISISSGRNICKTKYSPFLTIYIPIAQCNVEIHVIQIRYHISEIFLLKMFSIVFNPFGISHSIQLDQSFSILRIVEWYFSFVF